MENLVESVDMSMGAAMYIDHLKRASSKQIRMLKKENGELKEENKQLKQKLDGYEKARAKAATKAVASSLLSDMK